MINFIWAGLLVSGFVIGALTGNLDAVIATRLFFAM